MTLPLLPDQPDQSSRRNVPHAFQLPARARSSFMLATIPAVLLLLHAASAVAQAPSQPRTYVADFQAHVDRANTLTQRQQWKEARDEWRRVLAANPYLANGWYSLGVAERSAGDPDGAIHAFARYVDLGGVPADQRAFFGRNAPADVSYDISVIHATAGRQDSAVHWLQKALHLGLRNPLRLGTDTALREVWGDPRLAPFAAPRVSDPVEGRRADVRLLRAEIHRIHPAVHTTLSDIDAAADRLIADIPALSEDAFIVRLQRMLALVHSGHTVIALEGIERWARTLPVNFETLNDSLYIVAADRAYADLVGARIVGIGGRPVEDALAVLDSLASVDNRFGVYRARARNLRWPQISAALGLAPDDSTAQFDVVTLAGARKSVRIRARPAVAFVGGPPGYQFIPGAPDWITVDSLRRDVPLPLSRRDLRSAFWFTHLPNVRTVYLGLNSVADTPGESLADFATRLLGFVDSVRAARLIIDLRANNGGNSRLLPPLIDGIARSRLNRDGRLYALIGPYTFSAGMNAAGMLERQTRVTFVGEPTPSQPNWVGESNNFYLPNSRVTLSVSDVYWQVSWPFDQRQWIAPAIYLPPSLEMRRARRDYALEAVLAAPLPAP